MQEFCPPGENGPQRKSVLAGCARAHMPRAVGQNDLSCIFERFILEDVPSQLRSTLDPLDKSGGNATVRVLLFLKVNRPFHLRVQRLGRHLAAGHKRKPRQTKQRTESAGRILSTTACMPLSLSICMRTHALSVCMRTHAHASTRNAATPWTCIWRSCTSEPCKPCTHTHEPNVYERMLHSLVLQP